MNKPRRNCREAFIERTKPDPRSDCILFTGPFDWDGYGMFYHAKYLGGEGKTIRAPRMAYALFVGAVPHNREVLHQCDNPPCVNPAHLFVGTHYENAMDRHRKGRDASGERNGNVVLTEDDVIAIRKLHAAGGYSQDELGKHFGVSQITISRIVRRRNWTHV